MSTSVGASFPAGSFAGTGVAVAWASAGLGVAVGSAVLAHAAAVTPAVANAEMRINSRRLICFTLFLLTEHRLNEF